MISMQKPKMLDYIFYLLLYIIGALLNRYLGVDKWCLTLLALALTSPSALIAGLNIWKDGSNDLDAFNHLEKTNRKRLLRKKKYVDKSLKFARSKKKGKRK